MICETVSSESSRAENQIGWKAEQATLTASVPVIVAVFGAHPASSITSSPSPAYRIVCLPDAGSHGLRLPCLQQPPLANMRSDCRRERQQEVEDSEPHYPGSLGAAQTPR